MHYLQTCARMSGYSVAGACDGVCEEEVIVCEVGHGRDGEIQGAWSAWGCVRWLLVGHVCADMCACHRCVLPPGSAEWGV